MSVILPSFLSNFLLTTHRKEVDINTLYVGLINNKINYISVYETPHYKFAKKILNDNSKVILAQNSSNYKDYISMNSNSKTEKSFINLIMSIKNKGYDFKSSPILVFKPYRISFFKRWHVADGFHRLSILAALGNENIEVVILKRRLSIFNRLIQRIFNGK